jgi:AcrR family transcriptional regulator
MDSSGGQANRTKRPASEATRGRLMDAAAQLIAEVGWGRVTTRAVAERAGLPHGAVSYHFAGKQELLIEAALHAFEAAIPLQAFEALGTVDDVVAMIAAEVGDREAIDPRLAGLMMEAMREAERDPGLRERLGAMLATYRDVIVGLVHADRERGAAFAGAPATGIATLVAAVGDGLLLHALLDPELDVGAAIAALRALLGAGQA